MLDSSAILVVDPNVDARRLLELQLADQGVHVEVVAPMQVLQRATEGPLDLVLLVDPCPTGEETMQLLQRLRLVLQGPGPYVPVVLLTALADTRLQRQWRHAGADDVLTMPVQFEEVQVRLETLLRIRRLHQDLARRNQTLAETTARLTRMTETDALTLVGNRRHLQERLASAFQDALVHRSALSLLLIDLDHFKTVNDSYGHQAGDAVLQHVSRLLLQHSRGGDAVGRWGGEEFLILCPGATVDEAHQIAERLAADCAASPTPWDAGAIPVTLSVGVAELWAHQASRPEDLIRLADGALYAAKHHGRNQVRQPAADARVTFPHATSPDGGPDRRRPTR